MRTVKYDCGCVVMRDDSGHAQDVLRCPSHSNFRDIGQLVRLLDTVPTLGVKVVDSVKAKDKFGGR